MYRAKENIGDFKKDEIVPDEQAEKWLAMYAVPPVEKISGEAPKKEEVKKEEPKAEEPSGSALLDDYLARNSNVVIKNIKEDGLSKEQLEELYELEEKDKGRKTVLEAIEEALDELEE